jgi:Phosphatidylglycerol lysyltransferase, C-terminal
MSILLSSTEVTLASPTKALNEKSSSSGAYMLLNPINECSNGKDNTISKESKKIKEPKAPKTANEYLSTNAPIEPQVNGSKAAKSAKVKAPKAPKPPKAPEKTYCEKLGSDLADGLVKDPRLLGHSLNLVDRVSFVKLPQAATIHAAEDEDDDSLDSSLMNEFQEDDETVQKPSKEEKKMAKQYEPRGLGREIYDLNDFTALSSLQELICQYGRVSHMGILDKSYIFFITKDRKAALYYKIKNKIAVVGGDPLCPPHLFHHILSEFEKYRKKWGLGLAFLGAGQTFVDYARSQNYTTMCFAFERVLNPMTNPVLHSNAGKSIQRNTRNLLDPKKDGLSLKVYTPALGKNAVLQQQLVNVYEAWRNARNDSGRPQAYITVYDPFALPELMTYIYTIDRYGLPNGFAALRILGAENGYHLDPYVAAPGAPKGITDLLIYGTMSLLNTAKISYLSLGYEPLDDLGEICGIPKAFQNISRKVHKRIFDGLHVAGKKDYHDKFHPDQEQQQNLYLVFPPGIPGLRHMSAVVHVANIKLRKTIFKMPAMGHPISGILAKMHHESSERVDKGKESMDGSRLAVGRSTSEPDTVQTSKSSVEKGSSVSNASI